MLVKMNPNVTKDGICYKILVGKKKYFVFDVERPIITIDGKISHLVVESKAQDIRNFFIRAKRSGKYKYSESYDEIIANKFTIDRVTPICT